MHGQSVGEIRKHAGSKSGLGGIARDACAPPPGPAHNHHATTSPSCRPSRLASFYLMNDLRYIYSVAYSS